LLFSGVVHAIDVVGVCLLALSAAAIGFGQAALARADDFDALYWLAVGLAGLAAAVQITRPGKGKPG
jgi:hypothetical protein